MGKANEVVRKKIEIKLSNNKTLKDPIFVGLDPSYNGFGIMVLDKDATIIEQKLLTSTSKKEAEERIIELEEGFKFIPNIAGLHSVSLAGASYLSTGAFQIEMEVLDDYLRIFLFEKNIR